MSDRHLCKAKRTDTSEWIIGYYANVNGKAYICTGKYKDYGLYSCAECFEIDPSTICQCTGLKDKNGKLIWENDIIKSEKRGAAFNKCLVLWNECKARFDVRAMGCNFPMTLDECVDDISIGGLDYEVISNISDNPELFGGGIMTEQQAINGLNLLFSEYELNLPCTDSLEILNIAIKALEEIQQYHAIGTVEECRKAREKQRAKKPRLFMNEVSGMLVDYADGHGEYKTQTNNWWRCPCCNSVVGQRMIVHGRIYDQRKKKFCEDCGTKIDWSEKDE